MIKYGDKRESLDSKLSYGIRGEMPWSLSLFLCYLVIVRGEVLLPLQFVPKEWCCVVLWCLLTSPC